MKKGNLFIRLSLCILVFALISCNNLKENKQEKNEITKPSNFGDVLKEINLQIEDAVLKGDYETVLKFYTDDVILVPNSQPSLKGKSAVRESYLKQVKAGVRFHSFNARADKIWECGNEVYEYGTYGFSGSSNETKHPYAFTGSYFMIWEKQKDISYLIKYVISNLDFNPCKDFY